MRPFFFALPLGALLDLLLGDPRWALPHPVVLMGKAIAFLEKIFRRLLPKTPGGELAGGTLLALCLPLGSWGISFLLLWALGMIHPILAFLAESFMCYQILAGRSLWDESMLVYKELRKGDLEGARRMVGRIVGRDTQALSAEGVTRAAVETVAENTGDGVIAPLFFLMLGGAPLGFFYKAVNTMDSMVGYKNDRYLYFGRIPARLDDVMNFLPARLAGALMVLSAFLLPGYNGKNAFFIWRRDKRNHKSPNSAQTEAAAAGALGVELAGSAYYFGKLVEKPTIGDALRPIQPEDIPRVGKLMYCTSFCCLLLCLGGRLILWGGIL